MASHNQKLEWYADLICGKTRIDITFMGRSPVRIIPEAEAAVRALEAALLDNGYVLPIDATGSYSCRKIAGSDSWSLHAVPIAIDVDYPNNPVLNETLKPGWGTHPALTITERQVDAVDRIVNVQGQRIWKWLGWRTPKADPMHWELDVPRDKLEVAMDDEGKAPNIDECEAWQTASWQKAYDFDESLITEHTHPQDLMSKGDYFVFADRLGELDT